ncbi:hypothetical protein SAMN05660464_0937 [Geodermatophilus dictyosporus]|uniref:Uncharacterized protein n=1 Tax=Geodermatophilus dictyosporus TaxID=1523247 RepID=A0A1I5JQ71_9ACTN|nr:hypothetical protein [Geodermatophilus dictyosporus]SFO74860.1 hypothetical protein SAMN05660464_0937 [Geodermatophilus dictyosporus]
MTAPRSAPLAASLEVDPFTSLAVHFGMLLGVSDLQVLSAGPRGKLALHQAWQHGKGVVWGFPVTVGEDSAELTVGPGLCTDGLGREVSSGVDLCLDVRAWLEDQRQAGTVTTTEDGRFDARLVVRHEACLSRPVPTVASSCGQGGESVGYSRVLEFAHLDLRPYARRPADERDAAFRQLRELVRDGTLPPELTTGTGRLADFRAVAAHVVAGLGPPGLLPPRPADRTRLFPEDDPGEVVLADLPGMAVVRHGPGRWRLDAPVVDLSVRRSHVPTWVLSELLAELLDGTIDEQCPADAGGPRVERVRVDGATVTIELRGEVVAATVPTALEVRPFRVDTGWGDPVPLTPALTADRVTFDLPAAPTEDVTYRMVLRGTGPTPLVGLVDGRPVPLAGFVGDPPGTRGQGRDVVRRIPDRGAPS